MTISFSGLASGLDTSSWVESLVALKQAKVETLEEEKENVMSLQETLNSIKSFFSSFRSMLEKVTDAKFGVASMDLFAQNLATSSNLDVLTASATTEAEEGTYDVLVDQLASETQAVSNYSYMTTIIQTTTATGDSKLINLGVKAGNIGVNVNGVERGITITENDTISTFIEKLKNIGVEASYNEETGIFSINVDDNDINDIDGTGIVAALHLEGVNEGYTSNSLQTSKTDTVFSAATEDTLLSELGVNAGVITVEANDTAYNITIYNTSTLGTFISDLRGCNIDASLDENGIFTITDAEITSEGATNILDALGLTADVSEKSQITGDLTHQTIITQVTAATSSTLLKDIGDGTTISNGQTVIVKNSNNEYTTITVGTTTTIGELLAEMSNAGLYAAINSDGTVEITGGTITGGTFDAVGALGLEKEPYSAMVTGNALTETVEVRNPVTLQTRLVDDLKVTEGYLEVTDADGDKEYLKIYSGQTIADLMTDLANYGLSTDLDEETGVLSITGGAFKTLTDADVQALVNDGTIRETDSRYIHGTNLLECLYGAGTISTDHITVASTYSKTQALSHSVINTINASLTTTLGDLGLNNGTAVFDVRGENRTINVTTGMTIEDLMDALANQGIASSWDNEHSKITIENSTLTGGTSNLADVLNLTETISGKYVTSDQLYARETITIDATRDTVLADYGITNSMSTADRTVNLYHSDGTLADSMVVGEGTTIGNLLDFINAQSDISASLQNGILTIHNGYIENAALEASMGLETSNKSSYVLGNQMTVTTTAAVTGETTLGSIIATLGTQNEVAGGYTLNFNGTNLAVSANTTLNELINMIYDNGGTAALDHTGRLSINGGTLSGTVAEALGIKSVTHTSSVSASGETLYTEEEVYADRDTTLADLGINNSSYIIRDNLGNALNTINVSGTTTIGTFLDTLKANGIEGVIANGVISLESLEGKYITGALADALGIAVNSTTEVVNTTQSSTAAVTHTGTVTADITTTLGEIGAVTAGGGEKLLIYNSDQVCIATISSLTTSSTIGDMFDVLGAYGIQGSIINGVISLYSESGSYAAGEIMDNLGITVESGINTTFTIGQTITSSDRITYTDNTVATEDSLMLGLMPAPLSSLVVDVRHYEPDGSFSSIGSITITNSTTIGDFFDQLKQYQINGSIDDGVITLTSEEGNGVFHTYLQIYLGFDIHAVNVTITTGATSTSTTAITYTTVEEMTEDTKLGDIFNTYKIDTTMEAVMRGGAMTGSVIGISTADELQYLATLVNSGNYMTGKTLVLTDDIDLSGITDWTSIGARNYFNGTFDGQGHTISNLTQSLNDGTAEYGGLFGRASDSSTIKNIKLDNVNIKNGIVAQTNTDIDYIGAVVGYSTGGISGISVTNLAINDGLSSSGSAYIGGIAGFARFISDCYVQGSIQARISMADSALQLVVGGIVGLFKSYNSSINECNAVVDIETQFTNPLLLKQQKVGGIVGLISTPNAYTYSIRNSSFTGELRGHDEGIGGIVGELEYTGTSTAPAIILNIQNCIDHSSWYTGAAAAYRGYAMLGAQTNLSSSVNINVTNSFSDASHGSTSSDQKDFICTGPATVNLTNSGYKNGGSLYQAMVDSGYDMSMWDADGNVITSGGRYHMAVYDKDGNQLTSVEFSDETTIEDIMNALRPYGNVSLTNGVLSFTGTDGNLMVGGLAEALGIGVVKQISTVTVGTTVTSTAAITYTEVTTATRDTQIGDIITTYKIDGTITASGVTGTIIGISTAQELEWLADIVNRGNSMMGKTFVLTNNIDMSGITDWTPIGEIGTSSGSDLYSTTRVFAGTFDGQGHTISNLTMTSANPSRTDSLKTSGLFGCVANATIKNVNLNNFHINTDANFDISAGFLVARTNWGNNTISGITVANSSASCSVGGVVGQCYANTNISDCFTQFTVNTPNNDGIYLVGGITAEIRNWFTGWAHNNTLTVNITGSSSSFNASGSFYTAGGIVGRIYQPRVNATISDSGFTGSIRTTRSGHHGIAGIVGNYCVEADADKASYVTIKNTYSDAALSDTAYSGARNSGIINITGDYATRPTVFNSNISLIDNYYSGSYNSYLLIDSQFATVSTSNVQGNVSVSQFATIAAQRGFSPVDWDYASGLTTNTFAGPYQLIVKDKNGRQLYSSANQWDENTTLGEVMDVLKKYGDVTLIDGVLTFKGTDGNFITGLFAEDLGIETVETTTNKTVGTTATSTTAVKYMETVTASASTQLGEIVNTLVIDGTITASGVTGTVIGISNAQELEWLADIVNRGNGMSGKTFVLLNDIDMSGIDDWTPIGDYYLFRGTLDGQGHTIRNLTITSVNPSRTNATPGYGLFGYMNGTVKNLNLDNFYFDNDNYVDPTWGTAYGAGFLGVTIDSQYAANIENVSVTNSRATGTAAGLIHSVQGSATIRNCSTSFTLTAPDDNETYLGGGVVGSIATYKNNSTVLISGCSSDFTASGSYYFLGGIAGSFTNQTNNFVTIEDCYFEGSLQTSRDHYLGVGGIIGNYNAGKNDCTGTLNINRVFSNATLSASNPTQNVNGIIGGTDRDWGAEDPWTGTSRYTINITGAYYRNNYDAYYLSNSYATVNANYVGRLADSDDLLQTPAAAGFSPDKWDLRSNHLYAGYDVDYSNPYELFVAWDDSGIDTTYTFNETTTLASIVSRLQTDGYDVTLENGVLKLNDEGMFLGGPLAEYLGIGTDVTIDTIQNSLFSTAVISSTLTSNSTLDQVYLLSTGLGIAGNPQDHSYEISVYKDGSSHDITVSGADTLDDLFTQLAAYGVQGHVVDGRVQIDILEPNVEVYEMDSGLWTALKFNDPSFQNSYNVDNTYSGPVTAYEETNANRETTLRDLGITSNQYIYVRQNGVSTTVTLRADSTLADMFSQLAQYGITGNVNSSNGRITLTGSEDAYITSMSTTLRDKMKLQAVGNGYTYISGVQTSVTNTESDELTKSVLATATSATTLIDIAPNGLAVAVNPDTGLPIYSKKLGFRITVASDGTQHVLDFNNSSNTLGDVFNVLASYGIQAGIHNGTITITGTEDAYIVYPQTGGVPPIDRFNASVAEMFKTGSQKYYTASVDTTYTNDESDYFESTIKGELTTSTLFSELNVGADGYVTVNSDGTQYIVTVTPDMSVDDLISTLAGFGISGSVHDGKISFVGTENAYIKGMSTNIMNALALRVGENYTYKSESQVTTVTTSNELEETKTYTMTTSTTLDDLGVSANSYITVVSNGTEHIITITPDMTVDDMISTIAGFGISGSVIDGKLTFSADVDSYIKDMSQALKNALKLTAGNGNSWTTVEGATWVNSDSNDLSVEKDDMILTGDTVLSTIDGFKGGNLIVHQTDGKFVTINVDATGTLDDFFDKIADYGLVGSVDSEGRVTITGVGNVYLQAASGGSNILTSLNMSNVIYNVQTIRSNSTSDTLSHTIQVAASGSTTLDDLALSSGDEITFNGSGNVSLVLETTSDAGNQHITLTFSRTDSLYDVIDKLAEFGINASVDAMGRFSVTAPTLTDFDISGELGTFLMGAYHKEYGEDTTYNVSTNLVQETIVNMKDSDLLASFGVTGGNILITQQGVNYTVNVDMTKIQTVGDFRNLLSQYGFTTSIDDQGRLSVSGIGESYLTTISGGSNILDVFGLTDWTLGEVTQQSDHLTDTEVLVHAVSMKDKISELTNAAGNNLGITAGQIYVYQDGTRSTINIDTNDTLETLAAKLSQYGISIGISQEGRLYFDGNNDSYLTTDGLSSAAASNILEKIGIAGNWETRYDSTSAILDYTERVNNVVTGSTKLSDLQDASGNNLGITEGTYYVYSNGVRNTETITADMTVNDLMATLAYYGLVADIDENGSISVGAYNNTYLATSALAGQNSNIVSTLFAQWDFVNIYTSNGLDVPQDVIEAIDRDTKLADINEGVYQDGYITVIKDGVQTNISLAADDTVGTLMDELALYGFESVINEDGQLIIKNTGNSLLQNYVGPDKASNVLDLLGIGLNDWINTDSYKSDTIQVIETTNEDVSATRDTLLSALGVSTGEYYVYNNGVKYTALISSDETLGSFMDTLASFGLETSLVEGPNGSVLTVVGEGNSYIAKSTSTTNASNVVDVLFNNAQPSEKYEYKGLEQTSEIVTTYSAATEDTLVSYFDNGLLLAEGDLSVTVNGQTSIIKIDKDETFGSLLQKFRDLGLEATMNNGQIMIQSGFDTFTINTDGTTSNLQATAGLVYHDDLGGYAASNDTVKATTTNIEEKTLSVSNYADLSTQMGLLNISDGSLTVYRDGEKATIQINSNETFGDLRTRLSTAFSDLELSFENGYLSIYSKDGRAVEVGSTTDTSNFSAITGISKQEDGTSKSARELYRVNADSVITNSGLFRRGNVTEGTFYVGDAMFTITDTTTLANLISQINSSDEANATAYWDSIDGKFVIKSRTTGAALVNIEAGTSNFTDIMGYTKSEWNADGSLDVTRMNVDTQEIGDNAKVTINGTSYTSTSNTITSDVSRIKGLTINLKGLTEGSAVTLTVERDKETLANAVSDVVDSYNELMKNVDESIAIGGDLHDETTLKLIRNQLRNIMTSSDIGTTIFRNLDAIGISVDSASASNISTTTESIINLTFDKDKFIQAYEADEDAVKDLLIGGDNNTGIFTKAEELIESALQSVTGYFASADKSFDREIERLDDKITKANKEVERYRERLEAKFAAMDLLIAQMQQQYSTFLTT